MDYQLTRHSDGLTKTATSVGWIEWNDDSRFKEKFQEIAVGRSLILAPFNSYYYTWLTTDVTEILEQESNKIVFNTKNSKYTLTWS